jgi:hypothetical protein
VSGPTITLSGYDSDPDDTIGKYHKTYTKNIATFLPNLDPVNVSDVIDSLKQKIKNTSIDDLLTDAKYSLGKSTHFGTSRWMTWDSPDYSIDLDSVDVLIPMIGWKALDLTQGLDGYDIV